MRKRLRMQLGHRHYAQLHRFVIVVFLGELEGQVVRPSEKDVFADLWVFPQADKGAAPGVCKGSDIRTKQTRGM